MDAMLRRRRSMALAYQIARLRRQLVGQGLEQNGEIHGIETNYEKASTSGLHQPVHRLKI